MSGKFVIQYLQRNSDSAHASPESQGLFEVVVCVQCIVEAAGALARDYNGQHACYVAASDKGGVPLSQYMLFSASASLSNVQSASVAPFAKAPPPASPPYCVSAAAAASSCSTSSGE